MGQNNDVCRECLRYYNSGKTGGLNCAESTLNGVATYLGIDSDAVYRIATPFGGGLARNGYLCGSLAAGLMLIGLKFGRTSPDQERKPANDRADLLLKKFIADYGTINCREIIGLDLKDEAQVKAKKEDVHETICRPLVAKVCTWVTEIINAQ
ncbi:MAG: C_GCAxxG_C_C family protein [Firmicutes bacterium]|nr:C_GCAxxG_C_C family protein [Bacillota bacterium]